MKKEVKKMRKWILWIVVAYIMILMLTRNISFGDGNYRLAIGELDTKFNSEGSTPGIVVYNNKGDDDDVGNSMYVDNNGKIYVTGFSKNSSGYYYNYDMVIWRYNGDGTLDTTFDRDGIVVHNNAAGGNGNDGGNSIYVDSSGKIYVTGYSYNRRSGDRRRNKDMTIWRYNSDGTLDT
jgi:uncharacterized delta-60 repeat protein